MKKKTKILNILVAAELFNVENVLWMKDKDTCFADLDATEYIFFRKG